MGKKQEVRKKFREAVFKRDGFCCKFCDQKEGLDAHNITDRNDMPGGGYVPENGITLCDGDEGCHMKAEKFHISGGEEWVKYMHPDDLYKIIGSSKELAIEKSNERFNH